jgi:hypothetical protein
MLRELGDGYSLLRELDGDDSLLRELGGDDCLSLELVNGDDSLLRELEVSILRINLSFLVSVFDCVLLFKFIV